MRILYANYGPQSGVTASLSRSLEGARAEVAHVNVLEKFLYQLRPGSKIPNARPSVVRAVISAMRAHRRHWKPHYLHTTYAFDRMSEIAGHAIRRAGADAVLQSGVLFSPGVHPEIPYYLYLDHTRAIAERYQTIDGLPPPIPYSAAWRARERAVYRNAAALFTMSDFVRESLLETYGVDPRRVHVVRAGPNVEPAPGDLTVAREKAILFVGEDFVRKGGTDLLEAFLDVRRAHADAQLWIVSSWVPTPLPSGATFLGLVGKEALARLYARASVFALPSLREPFGLSLVEAMRFAVPVVSTRIEAIPEIVVDGETGFLVDPRTPQALAHAIRAMLDDPERARLMGRAGCARVLAHFGWSRAAAAILKVARGQVCAPVP